MLKVLWLRHASDEVRHWREALNSLSPPALQCQSGAEAARIIIEDPMVSILALSSSCPAGDLKELADALRHRNSPIEVILLSHQEGIPAVLVPVLDRHDVVPWVFEAAKTGTSLGEAINHISQKALARRQMHEFRQGLVARSGFVGRSSKNREFVERLARAAGNDDPVLIAGPVGSGGRRAARLVHELSFRRGSGPLKILEGRFLAREDSPSRVFGQHHASLTGGENLKGLIHSAAGGTLVLLDIEQAHPMLQMRLAELVSSRQFYRVGSNKPEPSDTRLIVTTEANLIDLSSKDKFRVDLLNEFASSPLEIPPLAERPEDVPAIALHVAQTVWEEYRSHDAFIGFNPDALDLLMENEWPYDRHGLRHFVERYFLIHGLDLDKPVSAADLKEELTLWMEAAKECQPNHIDLRTMRFCREFLLDHDRAANEVMYAYLTIQKRKRNKQQIADLFGKSSRWLEITINDLAGWFLEKGHRQDSELRRDQIWSRRFNRAEKSRRGDGAG